VAIGGYFAYDWYKKRNAAKSKGSEALAENPTEAKYEGVPFAEQPESVQMGDHLSLSEKESYIIANGNTSVFAGAGMSSADGDTDDTILEAALGEEDGAEGVDAVIEDTTFSNVMKDSKCMIDKFAAKFPKTDWGAVYADQVDALYVSTKCMKAEREGDKSCQNSEAVKKVAEKGRKSSEKMKERNPKAVAAILKGCKENRRRGKGGKNVGAKNPTATKNPAKREPRDRNGAQNNPPNFEEMGLKFNRPTRGKAHNERGSSSYDGWGSDNLSTGI
jgi:hypothetical protein